MRVPTHHETYIVFTNQTVQREVAILKLDR